MAQRFENLCSIAVLLMLFTNIHCTSEIVAEKCEDQYGADLNENFALHKQASQNSISNNGIANRLVDGNRDPYFGNNSCSETETATDGSYWEVDLGTEIYVTSVTITTRADDYWREGNRFSITVGNVLCASGQFVHDGKTTTYVCEKVEKDTHVRIDVLGLGKLSLCEVEVHGHPLNFYENTVNYALLQPAKMTSNFNSNSLASKVVDGIRNVLMNSGSCLHTNNNDGGDWWSVELSTLVDVYAVVITNRGNFTIPDWSNDLRMLDFEIHIGNNWQPSKNPTCNSNQPLLNAETRAIFCSHPMRGNNVGIVQKMSSKMTFCEISLHGRKVQSIVANEPVCLTPEPLGMENRNILDSQLLASSRFDENRGVDQARLNLPYNLDVSEGAWVPDSKNDPNPWMQVGFLWPAAVTEIQTQGRNHDTQKQWVKSFEFSSSDDFVVYELYKNGNGGTTFPGNSDRDTVVHHVLQPLRVVRIIRIRILSFRSWPSMRAEFVGCYYKDKGFPLPRALGMQSEEITDDLLSVSSVLADSSSYDKTHSRLWHRNAWIAKNEDVDPWIQVNFVLTVTIIEILTQGRSVYEQRTKNYKVVYAQDTNSFVIYLDENGQEKLFPGNNDRNTVVRNALSPAIRAQFIRIYPKAYLAHPTLRFELVGYYQDQKTGPLGMEDGRIKDVQLSASSEWSSNYGAKRGRLHGDGAWVAASNNHPQYLQVDFWRLVKVREIWTQGRMDPDQYITSYKVHYSLNAADFTEFKPYGDTWTISANVDGSSVIRRPVLPAIEARALRVNFNGYANRVSLRMEVIGYYITCTVSCYAKPLGMESGDISDIQITASTVWSSNVGQAGGTRLNFVSDGQERHGWAASSNDRTAWVQVAFYQMANIIEVQTQGRYTGQYFYNYTLSYGNNDVDFETYAIDDHVKIFPGNTDHTSIVSHSLWPIITARFIRITAISCPTYCAMRAEFIGSYEVNHGPELIDPDFVEFENTLKASSFKNLNRQPHHGIISNHFHQRAWAPLNNAREEYIQVDLLQLSVISAVGFRLAGDIMHDHYTKLILWYGDTEESLKILKDHTGNITLFDTSECYTILEKKLLTRYVRFRIDSWETRPDFRFQLYGSTEHSETTAGIETGNIKDDQMKSSNHPNDPNPAHEGRLNGAKAWCGNPSRQKLYLQVDFLWNFEVHGVDTQGKTVGIMEYVTNYKLSSSMDKITWNLYKEGEIDKIFPGNTNCKCIKKNAVQPFLARALRLLPTAWKDRPCVRLEVFGVYKGILRIHAQSGVLKGPDGKVVTRKSSIKLNGQEVSRKMPGYNIVVVNPTTGALISSSSAEDHSDVNDLLNNISSNSIVVIATQNVTQRPTDEILDPLESLGALNLRYSLLSQDFDFLLVGYKGDRRVNWIEEKLAKSKEGIIRLSVPIKLNEDDMKSAINERFVNSDKALETDLTLSGENAYVFRNITGRCGENNTDCEMGLSLSMWMNQEPVEYAENVKVPPTSERIELQYYSQGYNYIFVKDSKNWIEAQRYCLSIGATLPVYHDQLTKDYIWSLATRMGISSFFIGLHLHPRSLNYREWVDGSPAAILRWNSNTEPSGLPESCTVQYETYINDVATTNDHAANKFICQQPIKVLLGSDLFPLGMESNVTLNSHVNVSSFYDSRTPPYSGRLNRNSFPWCTKFDDKAPFIQVDLGHPTRVCGVATQGRGVDFTKLQYPTVFWVQLSNDSADWTTLLQHEERKYFRGNRDNYGVVINRFPQPEIAQIVRLNVEEWSGNKLCMGIELFGCKTAQDKTDQKVDSLLPPRTITDDMPKTCLDVLMRGKTSSGVYMIDPDGRGAFPAFCDQETDDGGWIVFQNRFDGSVDFNRIWDEYKWGFGNLYGEHWLGLEYIMRSTRATTMDWRVDLWSFSGEHEYIWYINSDISNEANSYTLYTGTHKGPGSNSMQSHKKNPFETKDKNSGDKPSTHEGAWWYGNDVKSNLNGKYFSVEQSSETTGIFWHGWKQFKTLSSTRMMMREGIHKSGYSLGLKDYDIKNIEMTATEVKSGRPADHARIGHNSFWATDWAGHSLTVYLISPRRITHISTQGGSNRLYVAKFSVQFKIQDRTIVDYTEHGKQRIFEANNVGTDTDTEAIISNCFNEPVEATEIVITPIDCSYGGCALRMELYACEDFCSTPVGIQSDRITTSATTMSLEKLYLFSNTLPWYPDHENVQEVHYVEIKFLELFRVGSIATKGGYYTSNGNEINCFVKRYYLMYRNERMKWVTHSGRKPKLFPGNTNKRTVVRNKIETPFLAHSVRLVPEIYENKACLKLEIYGCYPNNPSIVLYNDTVNLGEQLQLTGKYRYCPNCDQCPGCIKSICLRVFGKKYLIASYFVYDCVYHDFQITLDSAAVPGRHRIHLIESEYALCHVIENEQGYTERIIGNIHVKKEPSNCLELLLSGNTENGKYLIDPDGKGSFEVYCDQSLYGGGWTVIQTRASDEEGFNRAWIFYKLGFGDLEKDFWLGNNYIHRLTAERKELLLELKSFTDDDVAFVLYKSFQVSDEDDGFRLHVAEYERSPAGNCLEEFNGEKFTTHNVDNDKNDNENCANIGLHGVGWWYGNCSNCRLNGIPKQNYKERRRPQYSTWTGKSVLQETKMKVRDRETVFCNNHYCYYVLKTWNNWFDASQQCRRFNSDLVSIRDATENEWLRNEILLKFGIDKVHIGLKNGTWTDGGTFAFHNFSSQVENNSCAVLIDDGSWKHQDCTLKSRVLCKRGKWCFNGRCHVIGYQHLTISSATQYCHDIGYKLSKIRNKEEYEYIRRINTASTSDSGFRMAFFGLTLAYPRQPFWYDGKKARFTDWIHGEPNENSKSCAKLWDAGWRDAPCFGSYTGYPLCEMVYQENPLDCLDLLLSGATVSGIYTIEPDGLGPIKVYCDQETFGGGWTVLLRRVNGRLSFNETWTNYKDGFGHLEREFWLGNDYNHRLTKLEQEVLFDLESEPGDNGFALYKTFQVADEEHKYNLTIAGYQSSNIGNAMERNNFMAFTTKDVDNDIYESSNCGATRSSGWWFNDCSLSCLTGDYNSDDNLNKPSWRTWTSNDRIAKAEMKIRTSSVVTCDERFCYYVKYAKKTWSEALKECRDFNADLVSIPSVVEMNFILENIMVPQAIDSVHLGLTASNSWTDGSSVTVNNLPTPVTAGQCSSISQDGSWIQNDCNEKKTVLCKRGKHCHKGDCYFLNSDVMLGQLAFARCQEFGYRAVKCSSDDEKDYLLKLVRESTSHSSSFHLFNGLFYTTDEDRVWHDGTLLKYNYWYISEPNSPPSEIYHVFDKNGFYDVPTANQYKILCEKAPIIKNCQEVKERYDRSDSGVYAYDSESQVIFPAYCELGVKDGTWLVLQRRVFGTTPADFATHTWAQFRDGFGSKENNFWLGNKYIHELTRENPHRLKIVMYTDDFHTYEAIYEDFYLSSETSNFAIHFGAYSGNAGDALSKHRGMPFSSSDVDYTALACVASHLGGWWFENCLDSNLNGVFTSPSNSESTIFWRTFKGNIMKTEMKIQPYPQGSRVRQTNQGQTTSLSLTSKQGWMEINLQTASQQWVAHVLNPGPFITHVLITWEESAYLRYYENGTLVSEVAAMIHEHPGDPYTSLSVFVDLPRLWLHQLKVWDQQLISSHGYDEYATTEIRFENEEDLKWTFNNTSNYTWQPRQTCTPSNKTGPCGDHTYYRNRGTFMTTEASRPSYPMDVAMMESRTFLDHYKCLSFWYHMFGRKMGSLSVYAIKSNEEERILLAEISGNMGNHWRLMEINLDQDDFDLAGVFKIIVEAKRGEGFQSDVAVDDISLTKEKCKLECDPPCELGMKCDSVLLQCVYAGIYDNLWTLDNTLSLNGSVLNQIPGVIDKAIHITDGGGTLSHFWDRCFNYDCFPKYTLSFWLKYKRISFNQQYLLSFSDRFVIYQDYSEPKDYLTVQSRVAFSRCNFKVFIPAEVWAHLIFVVKDENFTVYLNGQKVDNTTLDCSEFASGPGWDIYLRLGDYYLYGYGYGPKDFSLDDVRLLFDSMSAEDTLDNYKTITGYHQTVRFKANFTTITWEEDMNDDESAVFRSTSQLVSNKIIAALGGRSYIKNVEVVKFMKGGTTAEVDIIYHNVSYNDILLLEEAIFVNNTLDDLSVKGIEMDSNSVPNYRPENVTAVSTNGTTLSISWMPIFPEYDNGVFQGYKILYKTTEGSSYTEYMSTIKYGNYTEDLITDLEPVTNYTLRVLAFTLSGDGLISDPVTVLTIDGEVTESPNITVANVSSTSLYVNWTLLPSSTDEYKRLLGYKMSYWKESEESQIFNMTFYPNESRILLDNLEKWTIYCFEIAGFTTPGLGPNDTQCARTFEDAPENPPSNVSVTQLTTSSIQFEWLPPPDVPGIIRHYNISYRVLNISNSEVIDLVLPGSSRSYSIQGLTGLMLCEINITAFTIDVGPIQTITALTNEGVPLVAPNISLINISSTSLEMNWTGLPSEFHNGILLGYKISVWEKDRLSGIRTELNARTFTPDEFYQQMTNLTKWTVYCVKITGCTAVGSGPSSPTECTRTNEDAPEESPRNLAAVDIDVTTIDIEWDPPPDEATPGLVRLYNISYRNLNYTNENLTTLVVEASSESLLLENLHGLTLYEINVTAITILPGPWETLLVLTEEGVPVIPPPNVLWTNLSSTSIKSSWELIPPHLCNGIITGYKLSFWKQSDPTIVTTVSVSEQFKGFEQLEKWTIYCGQVAALTKVGEGPLSQVGCIRTSEDEPEVAPLSLNGTNVTWTSFYLDWESIDPSFIPGVLRSYRVSYEIQDPGFHHAYDGFILVDSNETSTNLTGLIGLTNYKITVSGVTVKDGPVIEMYLQTKEGVPTSPPEEIVPTDVTPTTISLSWKDIFLPERHGIIKGYRVTYRKLEERSRRDTEEKTLTFDANVLTAFMYKLYPYTNYSITVAGFTSKGLGAEEHFIITTKQGKPGVSPKIPYGVNFTGPTTIFIGWGSLTKAELQGLLVGYEVRYRKFSQADEIIQDPTPEISQIVTSDVNGVKVTGLETYTTYQVRIAAISGGGVGTFSGTFYVATCRCHKMLTTNYWNYQPYANVSSENPKGGFFPYLLDMVTLSCCQNCLEHGTSEVDYFHDGLGNAPERDSDINVKRELNLETDFSFPIYGYYGQTQYMKYYGFAAIVEIVGTVFFTLKPDYSLSQGSILLESAMSVVPFLAIAVLFAFIAGVIMWALECGSNEDEFPSKFFKGAASGFWWAYITMTTVGYGDKTARTLAGRVFAVVWVLTGLCICSLLIGTIATAFTTSTTPPDPEDIIIYGSKVAALTDSPDHRLGLRRNAKINTDNKTYETLEELKKVLLSGAVDGILVDAYVADARKELFSPFMIKKVIDLSSTYGVVMGTNAKKLRKCFNKFWRENTAARSNFIQEHSSPAKVSELSTSDILGGTYNPQTALYQISLYSCAAALIVLTFFGCVYEIFRRKKVAMKVHCEQESTENSCDSQDETKLFIESFNTNINKLRRKQMGELSAFLKKREQEQTENDVDETT